MRRSIGFTHGAVLALALAAACYDDGDPPPRDEETCAPVTCESVAARCGEVPDGCGGVLACGDCPQGQTCGGGGPNACGTAACTPATCEALGAACGMAGDGCGGVLACGDCPEGQACGAGGVANQCGEAPAPPQQPPPSQPPGDEGGATRWALASGGRGNERVAGIAAGGDGVTVALTVIGDDPERPEAIGLVWISPDGRALRDRTYPVSGRFSFGPDPLAVSPAGDVFVAVQAECAEGGCAELLQGDVTSGVVVKLSGDGDFLWRAELPNGVGSNVAADGEGGAVVAESFADAGLDPVTIHRLGPGGDVEWSFAGAPEARAAVAIAPGGDVVVAQQWAVTRLDGSGAPRWSRSLQPADAFLTAVGVAGDGSVVAGGLQGDAVSVGDFTAAPPAGAERGAFLVRFGKDGAPVWARSAGPAALLRADGIAADVDLAVHPDGFTGLLVGGRGCDLRIERWDADGNRAWTRGVDAPGCSGMAVFASSVDVASEGGIRAGGGFERPVDFGAGVLQPEGGRDGFVLELTP